MALTAAGRALTDAHHARQLALRAQSLEGLLSLWVGVDPANLSGTIDTFVRAAIYLTESGHRDSAALASQYYELFRTVEGIIGAAIAPRVSVGPSRDVLGAQIRGSALSGIINARRAGMTIEGAKRHGFVKLAGTVTKLVLAGGRQTLLQTVAADPKVVGWLRVTSGDPCAFCRMLASRGVTFKSERSADFKPHDGCGCSAEPSYSRDVPDQAKQYREEWAARCAAEERAQGVERAPTKNDALNAYRRYLAQETPAPAGAGDDGQ